jgi:O-antigen ligase
MRRVAASLAEALMLRWKSVDDMIWLSLLACLAALLFSVAIAQAAAVAMILFWLYKLVRTRKCRFQRGLLPVAFTVYLVVRAVSILFSVRPDLSVVALRTDLFFCLIFYVVLCEFHVCNTDRILAVFRVLFWSGVAAALVGSARCLAGDVPRATSTTAGYYSLGMYLSTVLAVTLVMGRDKRLFTDRRIWYAGSLVMIIGILLTFNRIHWATMALSILVAGIMRERRLLAVAVLVGLVAMIAVPQIAERIGTVSAIGSHTSGRDVLWRGAFMIIGERPVFGFGLRTFEVVFPLMHDMPDKSVGSWHNDYLQVLMDTGLLGLSSLLFLLGVTVQQAIASLRNLPRQEPMRAVIAALLLAVMGYLIAGGINDTLLSFPFRVFIAIIALVSASKIGGHAPARIENG